MGGAVKIRLEVYLAFRGARIWLGEEEVPAGTTTGALPGMLGLAEPELAVIVNGRSVSDEALLQPGDEVAVLRRVEGGCIVGPTAGDPR